MTNWSGPDGEPTLADGQREFFPVYQCWRAISGLYYARPSSDQPGEPAPVKGEDPRDLRDMIIRHRARRAEEEYWRTT